MVNNGRLAILCGHHFHLCGFNLLVESQYEEKGQMSYPSKADDKYEKNSDRIKLVHLVLGVVLLVGGWHTCAIFNAIIMLIPYLLDIRKELININYALDDIKFNKEIQKHRDELERIRKEHNYGMAFMNIPDRD